MVLYTVFLIAHVSFVLVLFHTRYYTRELYPWFFGFVIASTVQAGVTIIIPVASVWGNRWVWAPVEAVLLLTTLTGMGEAIWRRMRLMDRLLRFWLLFGLVVSTFSATAILRGLPSGSYTYPQFLADRSWLFCWLAIAGVIGFGFGVSKEVRAPKVTRTHLIIYSLLMISHVVIPSWERWTGTNALYRMVVIALFGAWSMSALRLRDDLRLLRVYGHDDHGSPSPGGIARSATSRVESPDLSAPLATRFDEQAYVRIAQPVRRGETGTRQSA